MIVGVVVLYLVVHSINTTMRKLIVLSFISIDGVVQAPGGSEEDTSGGFNYGGWTAPYQDEASGKIMEKLLKPADLLLGRKTYDIFASYWPLHEDDWPGISDVTKYVVSSTMKKLDLIAIGWKNSVLLESLEDIKELRNSEGADIKIWGSGNLIQSLFKNDLVDEFWLLIHPLTLGKGKKLFDNGTVAAAFTLAESTVTPGGVIIANYKRAGDVRTGTVGA
jgi:dihydrofolate reductase